MEIKAYWIREGSVEGVSCCNERELDKNVCFVLPRWKVLNNDRKVDVDLRQQIAFSLIGKLHYNVIKSSL